MYVPMYHMYSINIYRNTHIYEHKYVIFHWPIFVLPFSNRGFYHSQKPSQYDENSF